jgi:multiple sugar transport system ATP-binding protein
VPQDKTRSLVSYKGQQVIFGIRPEDIHDPDFTPPEVQEARIRSTVDVTELMGNEVFLYLVTGENSFTARVDPRTRARVGVEIEAVLNMANMHVFEPQTEKAIF